MTEINFDELFKKLPDKPLLSLFEVASFLNLSKRTIYRWYPDVLNGTNLKGSIRIYRTSVISFVIQNNGKKVNDEDLREINAKCEKKEGRKSSWVRKW
jgi:hypothetical protein